MHEQVIVRLNWSEGLQKHVTFSSLAAHEHTLIQCEAGYLLVKAGQATWHMLQGKSVHADSYHQIADVL